MFHCVPPHTRASVGSGAMPSILPGGFILMLSFSASSSLLPSMLSHMVSQALLTLPMLNSPLSHEVSSAPITCSTCSYLPWSNSCMAHSYLDQSSNMIWSIQYNMAQSVDKGPQRMVSKVEINITGEAIIVKACNILVSSGRNVCDNVLFAQGLAL